MFNVHSVPIRWFPLEITRVIQSTEMPSNLLTQVVLYTAVRYVMWFGKAFSLPGISFWCIYEKFASNSLQIFFSLPSVIDISAKSRVKYRQIRNIPIELSQV